MSLILELDDNLVDMFCRDNNCGKKYIKNCFYIKNIRGYSKIRQKETFKLR